MSTFPPPPTSSGAHGSVHVPYRAVLAWKSGGCNAGLRRYSFASLGHPQAPSGGDRRTSTASSAGVPVSAGSGVGSADRRASLAVGSLGVGIEHRPSFNAAAVGTGARRSSVPAAVSRSASTSFSRCASPAPLVLVPIAELPNEERTEQRISGPDNATADASCGGASETSTSGLPILSAENLLRCVTPRPVTPSLNQRRSSHVVSPGPMSLIVPTLPVSHRSRNSSSGGGHRYMRHPSEQATFIGQVLFQNLQLEYFI